MQLKTKLFGTVYEFSSLVEVLAKANEEKSGDSLAGIGAKTDTERVAAKIVLSNLLVSDLRNNPAVSYEDDEVTRIIQDDVNEKIYGEIKNWSLCELREWLLDYKTTNSQIKRISRGLTSEVIAGVTKLMNNMDLVYGAQKIVVEATCNTTIGSIGRLSARCQPNHTTDNLDGIRISTYEALSYGIGDAVIGLNPVVDTTDNVRRVLEMFEEIKNKWRIPTQICVLSHILTQMEAVKKGAPSDMIFQSIAGTEKGLEAFGVTTKMLEEANDLMRKFGTAKGPNVMYFETGQGAELSSGAHHGVDQLTLEARCYGLAKRYNPFLVNTVVGFIGPEYLYDSRQVIRAGLEDHFMGKLTGVSMGVDACYTNHMKADSNDLDNLEILLTNAGCNFFMGIPAGDDVMLNYQTTSFHNTATLRELTNKRPNAEFEIWLEKMGIMKDGRLTQIAGDASIFL